MNELKNLFLGLASFLVIMATGVATMINGWGLQPVNWWWILGGSTIGYLVAALFKAVADQ